MRISSGASGLIENPLRVFLAVCRQPRLTLSGRGRMRSRPNGPILAASTDAEQIWRSSVRRRSSHGGRSGIRRRCFGRPGGCPTGGTRQSTKHLYCTDGRGFREWIGEKTCSIASNRSLARAPRWSGRSLVTRLKHCSMGSQNAPRQRSSRPRRLPRRVVLPRSSSIVAIDRELHPGRLEWHRSGSAEPAARKRSGRLAHHHGRS